MTASLAALPNREVATMSACTTQAAPAPASPNLAATVRVATATIAGWASRFGAWHAQRAKAARDRETLAQMNDRELNDIGVGRGLVDHVASGAWQRDAVR